MRTRIAWAAALLLAACPKSPAAPVDAGPVEVDAGPPAVDAGPEDAGPEDAGPPDSGVFADVYADDLPAPEDPGGALSPEEIVAPVGADTPFGDALRLLAAGRFEEALAATRRLRAADPTLGDAKQLLSALERRAAPLVCHAAPDGGADAGAPPDAGLADAGADAGVADSGATDAGVADAGAPDAGAADAGATDAGADAGPAAEPALRYLRAEPESPPTFTRPKTGEVRYLAAPYYTLTRRADDTEPVGEVRLNAPLQVLQVRGTYAKVSAAERRPPFVFLRHEADGGLDEAAAPSGPAPEPYHLEGWVERGLLAPAPLDRAELLTRAARAEGGGHYAQALPLLRLAEALGATREVVARRLRAELAVGDYQAAVDSATVLDGRPLGCVIEPGLELAVGCRGNRGRLSGIEPDGELKELAKLGRDACLAPPNPPTCTCYEDREAERAHRAEVASYEAAREKRFPGGPWLRIELHEAVSLADRARSLWVYVRPFSAQYGCDSTHYANDQPFYLADRPLRPPGRDATTVSLWARLPTWDQQVVWGLVEAADHADAVRQLVAASGLANDQGPEPFVVGQGEVRDTLFCAGCGCGD